MTRLVGAELLKFRTTRASLGFVLVLLLFAGVSSAGTVGTAEDDLLGTAELSREIVSAALWAGVIAFLVGILAVTSEWRHGTVTRTFLGTPRRGRVLLAKEAAVVLLAIAFAVLGLVVVLTVALPWLVAVGSSFELDAGVLGLGGRVVLAAALWGLLGVGVGALVHSQTLALVGAVVWVLLAESLLQAVLGIVDLEHAADYLPGRALSAFDTTEEGGLSSLAGGAVALAWIVVLGAAGYLRTSRRDVT